MEIRSNNIILASKAKIVKSFFAKARGLMFARWLKPGSALVFEFDKESKIDTAVHMLFVFFKIDVLWLNSEGVVVDLRRGLTPFVGFAKPKKRAKFVVELPAGAAKTVNEGDKLEFRYDD